MLTNRWKKALKAEAAAWKVSSYPQKLTDRVRRESLANMCEQTLLSEEELTNMRILEIGGAFVECAFDSVTIPPKLALDPLFPFPRLIGQRDKSCHRVRGVGEYLPLPDNSIDLCLCGNVIDHTSSPVAVLREIKRVLDDRGMLVIGCNIFPTCTRPLFPLFNIFDKPHPHHFTLGTFRTLLKRQFQIQEETGRSCSNRILLAKNLKTNIAAIIGVRYFRFRCTP